jgi:hypothetical protein
LGQRLAGSLKRLQDADREASEAGDVFGAVAGADATAILVIIPVEEVMGTFNAPVSAIKGEHTLR